jgi:hypothetical protein
VVPKAPPTSDQRSPIKPLLQRDRRRKEPNGSALASHKVGIACEAAICALLGSVCTGREGVFGTGETALVTNMTNRFREPKVGLGSARQHVIRPPSKMEKQGSWNWG